MFPVKIVDTGALLRASKLDLNSEVSVIALSRISTQYGYVCGNEQLLCQPCFRLLGLRTTDSTSFTRFVFIREAVDD